jgi:hypothetical protein
MRGTRRSFRDLPIARTLRVAATAWMVLLPWQVAMTAKSQRLEVRREWRLHFDV